MEKLSHEDRVRLAYCLGASKAMLESGYDLAAVKEATAGMLPEGLEKDAFFGRLLGLAGRGLIRGAKALRAGRMAGQVIKPGAKSFSFLENIPRRVGMELTRMGKQPGAGLWEMAKGVGGNAIFPGMIQSKSMIGKGIGTGIFAKNMLGSGQ